MKQMKLWFGAVFFFSLLAPSAAFSQEFKSWENQSKQYKSWLHLLRSDPYRYWTKLDSTTRPHKLYVGEGFYRADDQSRRTFVEVFSHYLAGHPEKFVLIDLMDATTGKHVGEFGFGGYRLYKKKVTHSTSRH